MRAKFPGKKLFTDPSAPKLVIRVCRKSGGCGGLNDRLGQLGWDLYIAVQTNRLFLIWWESPKLEEFLLPNRIDWSVPPEGEALLKGEPQRLFQNLRYEWDMRDQAWDSKIETSIKAALNGTTKDEKILVHSLTSHAKGSFFEKKLKASGLAHDIESAPMFGNIFRLFFRPSAPVQEVIDRTSSTLGLLPGEFTAVHLRVRYPVWVGQRVDDSADRHGLKWDGDRKQIAISQALHAFRCSRMLLKQPDEKLYLMADASKLVNFFANSAQNLTSEDSQYSSLEPDSLQMIRSLKIVAREDSNENLHIDRDIDRDAKLYYPSFVDLLIASKARCVAYGQGRYGLFTAKLGGTACQLWYEKETAPVIEPGKEHAPFCAKKANNTFDIIYPKNIKGETVHGFQQFQNSLQLV